MQYVTVEAKDEHSGETIGAYVIKTGQTPTIPMVLSVAFIDTNGTVFELGGDYITAAQ